MGETSEFLIQGYDPSLCGEWNGFVADARNATFLFDRGYMDYHSDRFSDASMVAFRDGKIVGLLPANRAGSTLHSHQGLTYGGWILPRNHFDASGFLLLWDAWLAHCRAEGYTEILYKPLPPIYHFFPSQADEYALFRCGAERMEVNLSSTVDLRRNRGFNTLMRRQLRKAAQTGLAVEETDDVAAFVAMLAECLRERHGAVPVHSAAELALLRSRFPDRIRLFAVFADGAMQAGVCVYDAGTVAHAQYIASTPEGRRLHLLPLVFNHLIGNVFADRRYFDFGISNEDHGRVLNEGLLRQKTAFGGDPTVYSRYRIKL